MPGQYNRISARAGKLESTRAEDQEECQGRRKGRLAGQANKNKRSIDSRTGTLPGLVYKNAARAGENTRLSWTRTRTKANNIISG